MSIVESKITRRKFCTRSAALLAVSGLGCLSEKSTKTDKEPADQPKLATGYIDSHAHAWVSDYKKYPLAEGASLKKLPLQKFTPQDLLDIAKPLGVSKIVLIAQGIFGKDNRCMLDTAKKYPGVFSVVAAIDENDSNIQKTMRALKKQSVQGFRIPVRAMHSSTSLQTPGFKRMWKAAADENLSICLLIHKSQLPMVAAVCQEFPQTSVVLDHFGGVDVNDEKELKTLLGLAKFKNVKVKLSAFHSKGKRHPPYLDVIPEIKRCYETFGPTRLMWGSNAPYQVARDDNTYKAALDLFHDHIDFLSPQDKDWILRRTAEETFFKTF